MTAHPDPQSARLLGSMYTQLGGAFVIDATGERSLWRKFIPQCDGAIANLTVADWQRVICMLETLIKALHPDDLTFVYDAFGEAETSTDCLYHEPMRRAA